MVGTPSVVLLWKFFRWYIVSLDSFLVSDSEPPTEKRWIPRIDYLRDPPLGRGRSQSLDVITDYSLWEPLLVEHLLGGVVPITLKLT